MKAVTGQQAIESVRVGSNSSGIPEQHRLFLRAEVFRLYPLLPDTLRAEVATDFSDFALRIDRIFGPLPGRQP